MFWRLFRKAVVWTELEDEFAGIKYMASERKPYYAHIWDAYRMYGLRVALHNLWVVLFRRPRRYVVNHHAK